MKTRLLLFLAAFSVLFLVDCAAGPNTVVGTPDSDGNVAGFWLGLWHGVIAPVTFVLSLFSNNVSFYEVHNNGGWYNFGFVLGAGILFGGGGRASSRGGAFRFGERRTPSNGPASPMP